jgi:hypothetical protein
LKNLVIVLVALFVFQSSVFSEEISAEELLIAVKEKYPYASDKFMKRAKEISHDVANIDEKLIRSEYLRADARHLQRVFNVSTWGTFFAFVGYIPGCVILVASVPKTQKIMLRKEMLFYRLVPAKQVSVGGNGANVVLEFSRSGEHYSNDETVFGF